MEQIPPTIATIDEPLPPLLGRPWDGSDLSDVIPVEMMLADLAGIDACDDYVARFRDWAEQTGIYLSVEISRGGDRYLTSVLRADSQMRHRGRYLYFLVNDLDRRPDVREELERQLVREGCYVDNRPVEPRQAASALRDYLKTGGRILITPQGGLRKDTSYPRAFIDGSEEEREEAVRASRAYHDINFRNRARQLIKRAARMLGAHEDNGWIVFEARP